MRNARPSRAGFALALLPLACTSHRVTVDPIEVKPIQVTVDVNVKVQRELEEFFEFEDEVDPDKGGGGTPSEAAAQPTQSGGGGGAAPISGHALTVPLVLASLAIGTTPQDSKQREELQQRMKGRYASLDRLRDSGKVGETFQGLAAAVKPEHEKEKVDPNDAKSQTIGDLVRAENDDRRALYRLLAAELKTTAEEIGKQNGIRNLKKAKPTHWFQLKSSLWAQRKDIKEEGG